MSGSAPWASRSASARQTGTSRGSPPAGAQETSVCAGPWAGLKKHGGRRWRERLTGGAGEHAGQRVAAVLERPGDRRDVLGPAGLVQQGLGVLVGVQRALVVLPHRRVELGGQGLDVQPGQLLAEAGDVLVGDLAHPRPGTRPPAARAAPLALLAGAAACRTSDADDEDQDDPLHAVSVAGSAQRHQASE